MLIDVTLQIVTRRAETAVVCGDLKAGRYGNVVPCSISVRHGADSDLLAGDLVTNSALLSARPLVTFSGRPAEQSEIDALIETRATVTSMNHDNNLSFLDEFLHVVIIISLFHYVHFITHI